MSLSYNPNKQTGDIIQIQPKSLLTAEEISKILRVSTGTIYKWAKEGKLPCIRIGKAVRFEIDVSKINSPLCNKSKKR